VVVVIAVDARTIPEEPSLLHGVCTKASLGDSRRYRAFR
jgi:hypothetical protein